VYPAHHGLTVRGGGGGERALHVFYNWLCTLVFYMLPQCVLWQQVRCAGFKCDDTSQL